MTPGAAASAPLLQVAGLTKAFEGLVALNSLDLEVVPRAIHGVVGPNGSGKTTFFNLVAGALRPSAGSIHFEGRDLVGLPAYKVARAGVGRTFQAGRIIGELKCAENVMTGIHHRSSHIPVALLRLPFTKSRIESEWAGDVSRLLVEVGLDACAGKWGADLTWMERQLTQIARALAGRPRLLLLDEPTAGMGLDETDRVRDLILAIRESGVTIVLISHDMRLVSSVSDRVTVLCYGRKIYEGSPQGLKDDPNVAEVYLGPE